MKTKNGTWLDVRVDGKTAKFCRMTTIDDLNFSWTATILIASGFVKIYAEPAVTTVDDTREGDAQGSKYPK